MEGHLCSSKLKYKRKGKYRNNNNSNNNNEEEEGKKEEKGR
jgi:hypothetical protein